MPLNGHNPHSFVIMDNCAIHHIQEIATMIEDVGSLVHYPYSPDFNPIDSAFLKVKLELQSELERPNTMEILLLQAFTSLTPHNCRNWVHETGIYIYK